MTSLIKCRKCGGPHITIKCGKTEPTQIPIEPHYKRGINVNRKNIVTVRITNMPNNITTDELSDLMCEWGRIGRINLNNYNDATSGFIDFYFKDEAEYFVKAVDRTPFDMMIIGAEILDDKKKF